jgi:hypothetical protein
VALLHSAVRTIRFWLLRVSRLAYNFHNSSRLLVWGPTSSVTLQVVPSIWLCSVETPSPHSASPRTYNYHNSSRILHLHLASKSYISLFAPTLLWLSLLLGRPLFRSSWDLMVASARSSPGLNPRRCRRLAHKGEIWGT